LKIKTTLMTVKRLMGRLGLLMVLMLALVQITFAQGRVVTGKVLNTKDGAPIANASVVEKGTGRGTNTNADGSFTLNVANDSAILVVSSVGFGRVEVAVGHRNEFDVRLVEELGSLNEVVVVGYGTSRKRDLTGAVASVNSKDFVKGAIQTPEQLIAGKVAGVQISSNSGAPGAGSRIRIRGGASLNASNDPLIVIDGVPVDNGGIAGSVNPLNMINPNDIENFTILKDPSAAAIYGSRASNGVILITTKKGTKGKVKFNLGAQLFVQTPSNNVDVLTGDQIREVITASGVQGDLAKLGAENTNWQDQIYKTAMGQDFNLSASGALMEGKLPFRLSGGYLNQDGILDEGNFRRQTLALNVSPRLFKNNLKVDLNIKASGTQTKYTDEGAIGSAIAFDPTQPVTVNSPRFGGYFTYINNGADGAPPADLSPANPVALLAMREDNSDVMRSIGNLQLDYTLPFVKGLRANLNLGYDYSQGSGTVVVTDSAASTYRRWDISNNPFKVNHYGGINNEYWSLRRNLLMDFYVNYVKDFKNSRLDVMGGTGYQDFYNYSRNYADYRYDKSVRAGTEPQFPSGYSEYTLISYYGRANYTIANKYVITANLRTDGTSKFSPDNRWGVFPSFAFAWRLSDEDFLKGSNVISNLKIRTGWGITGQQDGIDYYGYIPRYTLGNNAAQYQLGDQFVSVYRPAAYDPDLKWETTRSINLAVDFGFYDNRITGSIDVFNRKTEDLLSVVPIALGTNFSNQLLTNVGNIQSNGAEFTLNGTPVRNENTTWEVGFNLTYINPKITKLLLNEDPSFKGNLVGGIAGGTGNSIQIHSVDYRPYTYYVRKQVYDKAGKPIEGLYEDLNRDGIINDNDLYRYQSPDPKVFMGLNSNVAWKKWNAGFVARIFVDNYNYNNIESNLGVERQIVNPLGWVGNASANYLTTGFKNNQYFSDYYIQNASFFRMDNINIGYDAGEVIKNTRMRLYANVQNAFVITNYTGLDPEVNGGIDNQIYPRPRTFVLGLNLDF
jgi:TonB-dependent starch-binding outer membrane protein SusC